MQGCLAPVQRPVLAYVASVLDRKSGERFLGDRMSRFVFYNTIG